MATVSEVAGYMCASYQAKHGRQMDEMKLQKLLYFAQRESFAVRGKELFGEDMFGWVHGPVSVTVRRKYHEGTLEGGGLDLISRRIVNNVLAEYGGMDSLKLRQLSHQESSWINSRRGLGSNEKGSRVIAKEDIRLDALKVRPFDHAYGMYYDEFDDYRGEDR